MRNVYNFTSRCGVLKTRMSLFFLVFGLNIACEDSNIIVLMGEDDQSEPCVGTDCGVTPQSVCEKKKCPEGTKCYVSMTGEAICREKCDGSMDGQYRCKEDVQEMCNGEAWIEHPRSEGQACSEIDGCAYIIPNCVLDINENKIAEGSTFCKNNMTAVSGDTYSFGENAILSCENGRYVIAKKCDGDNSKCAVSVDANLNKIEAYCVDHKSCKNNEIKRCSENSDKRDKYTQCNISDWNRQDCENGKICAYTLEGVSCVSSQRICEEFEYKCDQEKNIIYYCKDGYWKEFADCGSVGAHCGRELNGAFYCKSWSDL